MKKVHLKFFSTITNNLLFDVVKEHAFKVWISVLLDFLITGQVIYRFLQLIAIVSKVMSVLLHVLRVIVDLN